MNQSRSSSARLIRPRESRSDCGPARSLKVRRVDVLADAKPWAGVRWRATAAVGAKGAPTALRCSGFGRAAKLASLTAFVALRQLRRVSLRSARVRAPTETLCSSPPHRRTTAHPHTAWRGNDGSLLEKAASRASSPACALWRAWGARQASGSMLVPCQPLFPKNLRSRKAWGRPVPGCVCDGEEHSPGVGARTRALRRLTRRNCPSATNAVSAASFAARPQGEHRSAPRAAGRRIRSPAPAGPKPCRSSTTDEQAYSRTFANSYNGPQADSRCMRRQLHEARRPLT
jgi:hypothetical protein